MKPLLLMHDYRKWTTKLMGQFADTSHVDRFIDATTKVISPSGEIVAVLLCHVIPLTLHKRGYQLLKRVNEVPSNRATAVGSPSLPRIKKDGTLSERRGVPKRALVVLERGGARQGTLGFLDATPDQPCHKTPLTTTHPEMLDGNKKLIKLVNQLHAQFLPTFYRKQKAEIERAHSWRLWDTVYSTLYVAKSLRTAYHSDSGNLKGAMTALLPMGRFTGGELVFPRWRIGFAFKPGDLLFFDPRQLHGNLPFEGHRLSAALYCEARIADCGE